MKTVLLPILFVVSFQMCSTTPKTGQGSCLTGKLVKKGICGQRVIQLLSEPKKGIEFAENWTDTLSGKKYKKVFTVANACDFSTSIKEGDEFTFILTNIPGADCIQCYAYTPVPSEKNTVLVGCTQ